MLQEKSKAAESDVGMGSHGAMAGPRDPLAELHSPEVQQLIGRWSKGDGRKQASLNRWLAQGLTGGGHTRVAGGGVELSDLTEELSSQFVSLVVPLLQRAVKRSAPGASVRVHVKQVRLFNSRLCTCGGFIRVFARAAA